MVPFKSFVEALLWVRDHVLGNCSILVGAERCEWHHFALNLMVLSRRRV
jgi:hypothetical protein